MFAPEKKNHFPSFLQIHSLTARSVPRQVREDLRKTTPDFHHLDKNIRLKDAPVSSKDSTTTAPPSSENECHVIYDSNKKDIVPYPKENAEFIRTPSPEHTGIPAGPVKMPPIRSWQSGAAVVSPGNGIGTNVRYTSDDSNASSEEPVKLPRRKIASKQNSNHNPNPSVRSLVEKYSC